MNLVLSALSHEHYFIGATEDASGHRHSFSGVTGSEIPLPERSGLGHIHEIYITHCSFLYLHSHEIKGITGPPVWISDTEHLHLIDGLTIACPADRHSHDFSGFTRASSMQP